MTHSELPDVSIIMPAWKSADFIATAIRSVQKQEGVNWELIIVDDASPDQTEQVVSAFALEDRRIRHEKLSENRGPSAARNLAIELSRASFIAVLDDDDSMDPRRLRTLIDLAETEKADIVVDNMFAVDDTPDRAVFRPFLDMSGAEPIVPLTLKEYLDPRSNIRFGESLGYLKPLFRKSALNVHYNESLRNSEDFYLVAELLAKGASMVLTSQPLYHYTLRQGSLSWRLDSERAAAIVSAHKRLNREYGHNFTKAEADASRRLLRARQNDHALALFIDALKKRRLARLISVAFAHPAAIPDFASWALRVCGEKVTARFSAASAEGIKSDSESSCR
ncbi:MAG: glycosyltransferase [Pseudomonadota bacterium]